MGNSYQGSSNIKTIEAGIVNRVSYLWWQASSEAMQLEVISRVCGTPTPADWPDIVKLPGWGTMKPKKSYRRRINDDFKVR